MKKLQTLKDTYALTNKQLATMIGVSEEAVRRWLMGISTSRNFTEDELVAIVKGHLELVEDDDEDFVQPEEVTAEDDALLDAFLDHLFEQIVASHTDNEDEDEDEDEDEYEYEYEYDYEEEEDEEDEDDEDDIPTDRADRTERTDVIIWNLINAVREAQKLTFDELGVEFKRFYEVATDPYTDAEIDQVKRVTGIDVRRIADLIRP